MELELAFADAGFIEKRIERIEANSRSMKAGERTEAEREIALLQRLKAGLEAETPLRAQEMSAEEKRLLVNYQFLTDKPLLVVLNINESDAARAPISRRSTARNTAGTARGYRCHQREDRAGAGADVGG